MAYKPNIVLIYSDDQGYGDVSALNPDAKFRTPNLDRLAREGIAFTDAHCSDTVCTPSRYGLLTGRYSWRTRLKKGVMGAEGDCLIAGGRMTLASFLKQHGYATAMIGKWHLGMKFAGRKGDRDWSAPVRDGPTEKGFDYYYGIPASMNYGILTYIENTRVTVAPALWTAKKPNRIALDDYRITPPYAKTRGDLNLEVAPNFNDQEVLTTLTRKAVDWIAKASGEARRGRPFFLYLAYTAPHKPVCPLPRFRGKSRAGAYGDFVLELDYHVGEILHALETHGLAENQRQRPGNHLPETRGDLPSPQQLRFPRRQTRHLRGRPPPALPHPLAWGGSAGPPLERTDLPDRPAGHLRRHARTETSAQCRRG